MKLLIKNKFISTIIGMVALYLGIGFILPINNFTVYITSHIHYKYDFVTMHYGLFINLIFSFVHPLSDSLAGYLENIIGFHQTILVGFVLLFMANFFFIFLQNIWECYVLSMILGIGTGLATALLVKNLTLYLPDKKGLINAGEGLGVMIISGIFSLLGEKIINFKGETLGDDDNYYSKDVSKNTYLYFSIGVFFLPIGLIFELLLIYEYKLQHVKQVDVNNTQDEKNNNNTKEKPVDKNEKEKEKKEEMKNTEEKENNEGKTYNDKKVNREELEKKEVKESKEITGEINKETNNLKMETSKQKLIQVIKTFRYWRITLISFFINISISFMVNTGRTFGAIIGINGTSLQYAGIIQTIVVLFIGPILGIIVDKKGPLLILRITSIFSIFPSIFLAFFMNYTIVFISCLIIYILVLIGFRVAFVPFIMEIYGIQESVLLGGIIHCFSMLSEISTIVSAFVFSIDCGKNKDCLKSRYRIMYLISGICCCISFLLLYIEKKDKFIYEKINIKEKSKLKKNEQKKNLVVNEENKFGIN